MNKIHLKPTQKFITFSKYNLVVHQDAQKALLIWHQFRPRIARACHQLSQTTQETR